MAVDEHLMANGINKFNEKPLHKALKEWCAGPEAEYEVPLDGYIIDAIVDGILIEVQTRKFQEAAEEAEEARSVASREAGTSGFGREVDRQA